MTNSPNPSFEDPAVNDYFSLHERVIGLEAQLDGASAVTQPLFEAAVSEAHLRLAYLESNETVLAGLRALAGPVLAEEKAALAELSEAEEATRGLVDPSVIEAQRENIGKSIAERVEADPKLATAWRVITRIAARATVSEATDKEASEPTQTAPMQHSLSIAEEKEKERTAVRITRQGNAVMVGNQGKTIRLSEAMYGKQRDYSEERWSVLKTLVALGGDGKQVSIKELWATAFPDKEIDSRAMGQVRRWLEKLTFRRQPIVVHNGKRSISSAYSIPNFEVTLQEQQITTSVRPKSQIPTLGSAETPDDDSEGVTSPEKHIDTSLFPLSHFETSIIANFFRIHAATLRKLDISTIPEDTIRRIDDTLDPGVASRENAMYIEQAGNIHAIREIILAKLKTFFDSDEKVLGAVDGLSDADPRYGLFEYLVEIDGDDRWQLFSQFRDENRGQTFVTSIGRRDVHTPQNVRRVQLVGGHNVFDDAPRDQGKPTSPRTIESRDEPTATITRSTTRIEPATQLREAGATSELTADATPPLAADVVALRGTKAAAEQRKAPLWHGRLYKAVEDTIAQFDAQGLMFEDVMSRATFKLLGKRTTMGTDTMMYRAVQNHIIKRSEVDSALSVQVYILMAIQNSFKGQFSEQTNLDFAREVVGKKVKEYFDNNSKNADRSAKL